MKLINATLVNLFHVCPRECWLHANSIRMEHNSDAVYDGKLLHEASYPQRAERYSEVEIGGSKIDFYDAKNKVIHEIKRSDKAEIAHEWQLKYYLLLLEENGIDNATGILEYPKLRETKTVYLNSCDRSYLSETRIKITALIESEECPSVLNAKICKSCSYYDFCYSTELE